MPRSPVPIVAFALLLVAGSAGAQTSTYRLTFPDAERRWMEVELTLADVPAAPLELHMSQSSPGRYGPHDFVRNVSGVEITGLSGEMLAVTHPTRQEWRIERPGQSVRVRYRVSGDRTDGTYFSVDRTHAHINMPAALLWARGFEDGGMTIRFEPPAGSGWRIATQLFPGSDAQTFTAPNLQYLMDSPTELSAFSLRTFTVTDDGVPATFRLAVHHLGSESELDALAVSAERLVRETRTVFGEFPRFEPGTYTFIADYLPAAAGDGMEHRNSTVLTSPSSLQSDRADALSAMSHEFFHAWNVERVRPRSLEPFDLTTTNESGELWLAEGFSDYYGPLLLTRAGLTSAVDFTAGMSDMVSRVLASPARRVRTLEEMSRFAPNIDSPTAPAPPNVNEVFLSYYTWGGAVALALDLSLRERSDDRVTLDDFMRTLWERHGRPGGRAPGLVAQPYTVADLKSALTAVSGDARFVDTFFARYIQGHDVIDYGPLLRRAGLVLRRTPSDGRGDARMEVVMAEAVGLTVTDAQRRVRAAWLESKVRP